MYSHKKNSNKSLFNDFRKTEVEDQQEKQVAITMLTWKNVILICIYKFYLTKRFIIYGEQPTIRFLVLCFVSQAVFVKNWLQLVVGGSHPQFQLSFHSDAGGPGS